MRLKNQSLTIALVILGAMMTSSLSVTAQQTFSGMRNTGKYSQSSTLEFQIDANNIVGGRFRIENNGKACFGCSTFPLGNFDVTSQGWIFFNNDISSIVGAPANGKPGSVGLGGAASYGQGIGFGVQRTAGKSIISYSNDVSSGPGWGLSPQLQIGKADRSTFTPDITIMEHKLGINTTGEFYTNLYVNGTSEFTDASAFRASTNFYGNVTATFANSIAELTNDGLYVMDPTRDDGVFIKPGKIGIGTLPQSALHVMGDATFEDVVTFKKTPVFTNFIATGTSTFENSTFSQNATFNGAVTFNGTSTFAGNFSAGAITSQNTSVGIGQAQPLGALDVASSGWSYFHNEVGSSVPAEYQGMALGYRNDVGASLIVYSGDPIITHGAAGPNGVEPITGITNQRLEFGSASLNNGFTSEMTLKKGNLGIGTVDPQAKLHVNGTSTFEDAVTFKKSTIFAEGIKLNTLGVGVTDPKFVLPATLYVNGTSTFEDAVTFKKSATFSQGVSLNSLAVNGTSTFTDVATFAKAPVFSQGISINQLGVSTTPVGLLHIGQGTIPEGGNGSANWVYFEGNAKLSSPSTSVMQGLAFGWNKSGNGESIVSYNKGAGTTPRLDFSSWNPTNGTFTTEMTLKDGRVGIGTTAPASALEVNGDITLRNDAGSRKQIFTFSPTDNNWRIGMSLNPGFTRTLSTSYIQYFTYSSAAGHGFALGVNGGQSSFEVRGSDHAAFFRGNVNVGTAVLDAAYRLSVGGKIRANEIVLESDWADFVFYDNYKLRTLREVDEFIQKNGHLPDVPSAAEVKEKGLSVSEMQTLMMQKIEELTLYVIELQKQNDDLKSQVKSQSK